MVRDRVTDGTRIAQLLSSEIHGRTSGPLGRLAVVEADPDAEPSEFGTFAYGVDLTADGDEATDGADRGEHATPADSDECADPLNRRLADAYVHPDRVHLAFRMGVDAAVDAGAEAGLRTRPKAVEPPRTLVFVGSGAEVKRATDVLERVVVSLRGDE